MGRIESVDYSIYSIISMADVIKKNGTKVIFDCGVDDFLIEPNRELHRRLVFNRTPHDYLNGPVGTHGNTGKTHCPYHVLFFYEVLKTNNTTVN